MKKVLLITNHLQYSDGVAISLRNLANALCKSFDVTILCIYNYDGKFAEGIDERIHVRRIFGFYFKGLRKISELFLPLIAKSDVFKEEYSLVVSYCWGTPTVLIDYLKKKGKINGKTIGFVHTYNPHQIPYYMELDSIICISEDGKRLVSQNFKYEGKLVHIRNIYCEDQIKDKSKIDNKMVKGIVKDKISFCTVSRISPEKGIDRFVRAIMNYHEQNPDVIGIIVGDGPCFRDIEKIIKDNDATEYIKMLGSQNNPYPIMRICDYYISASYREGLSTSCVEASILGKAILSTYVSGAEEIIYNPKVGIIVDNSQNGLNQGVLDIVKTQVPESNFIVSKQKWSAKITSNQYIEFFDELLEGIDLG